MSNALADVREIQRLLVLAYDHYFEHSDGHCKSSEAVVSLVWPTYWDLKDGNLEPACEVYSYVFGPNRNHYFDSTTEALVAVRKWYEYEMNSDYSDYYSTWGED